MGLDETVSAALSASVQECFSAVLGIQMEEYAKPQPDTADHQVASSIGFAGKLEGSLTVVVSEKTACAVVGKMLSMEFPEVSSDVTDGVAEVVNMTVGGVKSRLNAQFPMEISIPTTVRGKHMDVLPSKGLNRIYKSFRCADFDLDVYVYFKEHVDRPASSHAAPGSAAEKLEALLNKQKQGA